MMNIDRDTTKELLKFYNGTGYSIYGEQSLVPMIILFTDDVNQYLIKDEKHFHVKIDSRVFYVKDMYKDEFDCIANILESINEDKTNNTYLLCVYGITPKILDVISIEDEREALKYFVDSFRSYFKEKIVNKNVESNYFMINLSEADEWYNHYKGIHHNFSKAVEEDF